MAMAGSLSFAPALASAQEAQVLTTGSASAGEVEPASGGGQGGALASGSLSTGSFDESQRFDEYINGTIPVYKDVYVVDRLALRTMSGEDVADEDELPASYRSDEQPWAQNVRVKDQMKSSICWAFAMTSAMEYSYAKELYEQTGEVYAGELSPGHLAQFFYNRVMDPLENTEGDFNGYYGYENFTLAGGNQYIGMQHLATWSGLVSESEAPFEELEKHILARRDSGDTWDGSTGPYPSSLAYGHNELALEESVFYVIPTPTVMKQLILRYGACAIGVDFDWRKYMNLDEIDSETGEPYECGRSFYNYTNSFATNHTITVVGWDDAYPKENFRHEVAAEDGKTRTAMPEHDGAWIIQNSWNTDAHDNGFFYASYESAEFNGLGQGVFAYDMQPADTYDYNFQYDGTASWTDTSDRLSNGNRPPCWTGPGTSAANVYTNSAGHPVSLESVGFTTYNQGLTEYDVSVYTGLSDPNDPTGGTCRGTTRITTTTPGCKTAKLDQPVTVDEGEAYSIVFRFADITAFGLERADDWGWIRFYAQTDPGQSFFKPAKSSGGWQDMNEYEACFRIKGFASACTRDLTGAKVELSGEEFTYNGKTQKPEVLSIGGLRLTEGVDYTAEWSDAASTDEGAYSVTITGTGDYTGTATASYRIGKAPNYIALDDKTATVKYAELKEAGQTVAISKATGAQGAVTYSIAKAVKGTKILTSKFSINKSTGKITVAKGLAKGAYKVTVKAKAAGNANYKAGYKKAVVTVKVK
jgi:hypothetical protein